MMEKYDEDYYIRGLESGKSLYSQYRWMPELTIPLAYRLSRGLEIHDEDTILDFGCAMGYLVKAFRLLGFRSYGYEISQYALENVPIDIQEYVYHGYTWVRKKWDWIICKDVFEHIPYNHINQVIKDMRSCSRNIFIAVPLSDNGMNYNEPAYEFDSTHIIREDLTWWSNIFQSHLIEVVSAEYEMKGVKENWKKHKHSNGFFKLKTNII
jgi:SAM-dependent methyltransferase